MDAACVQGVVYIHHLTIIVMRVLSCLFVTFTFCGGMAASIPLADRSPSELTASVDCTPIAEFLEDEVMALTHTAIFGSSCVTIETLVHFGDDGVAEELAPDGTVIGSFSYTVMEVDGQCALASTASDCEVQLLSFTGDESAMTMSLNGAEATLTPTTCLFAPELGDVDVASVPSALTAAEGTLEVEVTAGAPTSVALAGINGAQDYDFVYPGAVDGILPGSYHVTALDADDCASPEVMVIVPFDLCCDCGVSDSDSDGLCDDEDNCTDKSAPNYADPANTPCAAE